MPLFSGLDVIEKSRSSRNIDATGDSHVVRRTQAS
jgi:hypothetical protein